MISLRKSVSELERMEQLRKLVANGYANAIRAAADYAIELDPGLIGELRRNLGKIREQLESASRPEDYEAVQSSFRGELRLYRDQSTEWLERLQRDLQSATMAMEVLAGGVTANGVDHERKLEGDLRLLASVEQSQDVAHIKRVVRTAADSIGESWQQLRHANQLVIAQLHDEIQALHREIDNERRAMFTDSSSGAWNRKKITQRIEDNLMRDEAFCLVLAAVTNLKRLGATFTRNVTDAALKAMVKRVYGVVGNDAMVGRWNEEEFAILLEIDSVQAIAVAAEISKQVSARYSIQQNGVARSLTLRVTTSTIERPRGGDPQKFHEKLELLELSQTG